MRRRKVFGQRKSLSQRLFRTAATVLLAALLLLGLIYVTLPWTGAFVLKRVLTAQGWGPVSLTLARSDVGGVEIHNLALAANTITAKRIGVTFTLRELLHAHIREFAIVGARVNARWSDDGISVGSHTLGMSGGGGARAPLIDRVNVTDTALSLTAGEITLTTSVWTDISRHDEYWTGKLNLETSAGADPDPVLRLAWDGAFAPTDPAKWRSHGTVALAAANMAIAEGATLDARGRLDLTTGDGSIALTAPDRLVLNLSALPAAARDQLPGALGRAVAGGVALQIGGRSKPGTALHWTATATTAEVDVDADVGVTSGERSLRVAIRGHATGPGGSAPDTLTDADVRLDAQALPTPVGTVTGRLTLTDLQGPLVAAEGRLAVTAATRAPSFGIAEATNAQIAGNGTIRLDGQAVTLEVAELALGLDDVKTPAGITVQGHTSIALAPVSTEPQTLGLVLGAEPTLTVALTAAARALIIGVPGAANQQESVLIDLPRLRIEGYATTAGGYDLGVRAASGSVGHGLADGRLSTANLRLQPALTTGAAEIGFTRIFGKPQRLQSADATGLKVQSDFKIAGHKLDLSSVFRSGHDAELAKGTITADLSANTGTIQFDVPRMQLGPTGVAIRDIFGANSPVTSASGTIESHAAASWGKEGHNDSVRLIVSNLSAQAPDFVIGGLAVNLDLSSLTPLKSAAAVQIKAAALNFGLPMQNLAVKANLPGDGTLVVSQAGVEGAGGRLGVAAQTKVPIDGSPATIALEVVGLDLSTLIGLAKVAGLTASGHLSGTLPVRRQGDAWLIANGHLSSDEIGVVSYRPASPPRALAGAGEPVLKALSNFHYDSMYATVTGNALKALKVKLAMKGKNPDLNGGYPSSFTLNLGGPLGGVLKQGIAGYNVGSDVVESPRNAPEQTTPPAQ